MVGGVFISVDIFLFTLFVSCEKINSVGILYPCTLQAIFNFCKPLSYIPPHGKRQSYNKPKSYIPLPAGGKVVFSFGLTLDSLRKRQTLGQAPQATENRPGHLLQRHDRQSSLLSDLIIILSLLFVNSCAMLSMVLPVTVGGQPPIIGGSFCAPAFQRGGVRMVTYSDLIQIGILIVGIIGIFMMYKNQK